MSEMIYKVCDRSAWEAALAEGAFHGSADDLRDGFIHLSRRDQLPGTLRKHFAARPGLLLIAFEAGSLGDALRYEPSRDGALFPHLYGPLLTQLARAVSTIEWRGDEPVYEVAQ